jgi:hypothetical protein
MKAHTKTKKMSKCERWVLTDQFEIDCITDKQAVSETLLCVTSGILTFTVGGQQAAEPCTTNLSVQSVQLDAACRAPLCSNFEVRLQAVRDRRQVLIKNIAARNDNSWAGCHCLPITWKNCRMCNGHLQLSDFVWHLHCRCKDAMQPERASVCSSTIHKDSTVGLVGSGFRDQTKFADRVQVCSKFRMKPHTVNTFCNTHNLLADPILAPM